MTRLLSTAIAALLMLGSASSCSSDDMAAEPAANEQAYLNLSFSTSSPATTTRADEGTLADNETKADPTSESDIHSIKVWVFENGTDGNATPLAYKEDIPSSTANGSYQLSLLFLKKIDGKDLEKIDLYILVNSESTDANLPNARTLTRKDLQALTFSSSFGIKSDGTPEATAVPDEKGLPISRAIKGISIADHVAVTETAAAAKAVKIPLVRAVSKLHFYFARKANANTDNVEITKIEIGGSTFPTNSYLFPDEEDYRTVDGNKEATSSKYDASTTYFDSTLKLDGVATNSITEVINPTTYKRGDNEAAQSYMDRMNKEIVGHDLCYLHETNKAIEGKIYYKWTGDGKEKSVDFTIPSNGYAIRNRELVVYGYFLEAGKLLVTPTVLDWNDGGTYTFKDAISIKTNVEKSNGDNIAFNNATYGPKISFTEFNTNGKSWVLQTDSPDYGFVYADKVNADGSYDLKNVLTVIQGDGSTTEVKPFHVVPKSELDYTVRNNYTCHVFMVAHSPNQKVIINAPADGSEGTAITGTPTEMTFTQVK